MSCLRLTILSILRFVAAGGQVFQADILEMHYRPFSMILQRKQPFAGSVLLVQVYQFRQDNTVD